MLQHNPPHPGGIIKRTYLKYCGLRSAEVAKKLKVSPATFNRLVNERSSVSPIMALKLSKVLGRSPESWMAMQRNFDIWKAKSEIDLSNYETIKF
jgi:addiction module HigA family antidote